MSSIRPLVTVWSSDLLLVSRLIAPLERGGYRVETVHEAESISQSSVAVIVEGPRMVPAELVGRTVVAYAHIDVEQRRSAIRAGVKVVVPRSRLVRDPVGTVTLVRADSALNDGDHGADDVGNDDGGQIREWHKSGPVCSIVAV